MRRYNFPASFDLVAVVANLIIPTIRFAMKMNFVFDDSSGFFIGDKDA